MTRTGVGWSTAGRFAIQAAQLGSTVVLSRYLSPAEYGLAAYVTVFVAFASLITDLGIGPAVIHMSQPSQRDLSTAFWANAVSGLALTFILIALAPLIAAGLSAPGLAPLLLIGSLNFTFALSAVHIALLERALMFRRVLIIECCSAICGVVTSISLALKGGGTASLVWGSVAATVVLSVSAWTALPWRPSLCFDRVSWTGIWRFSRGLFGFNAINYWGRNGDNLLVGRVAGTTLLGLYSRAYALMLFPVFTISTAVGRVLFPSLARVSSDQKRLRTAFLRSLGAAGAIGFPMSIGLACIAPTLVPLLYGSKWEGAAILLTLLSISGPPQMVNGTFGALLKAADMTPLLFRFGALGALTCLAAVGAGLPFGGVGITVAFSLQSYLFCGYVVVVTSRRVGLKIRSVIECLLPVVIATALMAAGCVLAGTLGIARPDKALSVTVEVVVGVSVYAVGLRFLAPALWKDMRSLRHSTESEGSTSGGMA